MWRRWRALPERAASAFSTAATREVLVVKCIRSS
jgi:hypothetical protein